MFVCTYPSMYVDTFILLQVQCPKCDRLFPNDRAFSQHWAFAEAALADRGRPHEKSAPPKVRVSRPPLFSAGRGGKAVRRPGAGAGYKEKEREREVEREVEDDCLTDTNGGKEEGMVSHRSEDKDKKSAANMDTADDSAGSGDKSCADGGRGDDGGDDGGEALKEAICPYVWGDCGDGSGCGVHGESDGICCRSSEHETKKRRTNGNEE